MRYFNYLIRNWCSQFCTVVEGDHAILPVTRTLRQEQPSVTQPSIITRGLIPSISMNNYPEAFSLPILQKYLIYILRTPELLPYLVVRNHVTACLTGVL